MKSIQPDNTQRQSALIESKVRTRIGALGFKNITGRQYYAAKTNQDGSFELLITGGGDHTASFLKDLHQGRIDSAKQKLEHEQIDIHVFVLGTTPSTDSTEASALLDGADLYRTPMMYAVLNNDFDLVKALYNKGADFTAKVTESYDEVYFDKTAIEMAQALGYTEILNYLLDALCIKLHSENSLSVSNIESIYWCAELAERHNAKALILKKYIANGGSLAALIAANPNKTTKNQKNTTAITTVIEQLTDINIKMNLKDFATVLLYYPDIALKLLEDGKFDVSQSTQSIGPEGSKHMSPLFIALNESIALNNDDYLAVIPKLLDGNKNTIHFEEAKLAAYKGENSIVDLFISQNMENKHALNELFRYAVSKKQFEIAKLFLLHTKPRDISATNIALLFYYNYPKSILDHTEPFPSEPRLLINKFKIGNTQYCLKTHELDGARRSKPATDETAEFLYHLLSGSLEEAKEALNGDSENKMNVNAYFYAVAQKSLTTKKGLYRTPLMMAIEQNDAELVQMLLNKGADLTPCVQLSSDKTFNGQSAFHFAWNCKPDNCFINPILKILLKHVEKQENPAELVPWDVKENIKHMRSEEAMDLQEEIKDLVKNIETKTSTQRDQVSASSLSSQNSLNGRSAERLFNGDQEAKTEEQTQIIATQTHS